MHQKHSNIIKASFGNFSRNEISFLGTPCSELKLLFEKILSNFPTKNIAIVEADHKADEEIKPFINFVDKINFTRFDIKHELNKFDRRPYFENADLVLVNGNHFDAEKQIIIVDSLKPLEKKLNKLTNVVLIILKDANIPEYILNHFEGKLPPILSWDDQQNIFQFIVNHLINSIPPLFGLVLAGGKSTRMGTDKGEIRYHGQLSQKTFAYDLLRKHCSDVFLSLNKDQAEITRENLPIIEDKFIGIGPMGGILSAFQKYPNSAWITIACDMPFLSDKSLNQLVSQRNPSKLATAFKSPDSDFPEPLITIWEPKAYQKLMQMLSYGIDCPRKTLINSDIELLVNLNEKELQNINTVDQFEKAIVDLSPQIAKNS